MAQRTKGAANGPTVTMGLLRVVETTGLLRGVETTGLLQAVASMGLLWPYYRLAKHGPITDRMMDHKWARVGIVGSWADHNGSSLIGHI